MYIKTKKNLKMTFLVYIKFYLYVTFCCDLTTVHHFRVENLKNEAVI